ncbi:MAG: hypothetical protein OCD02_13965 [Spirochaetaceae bacterium]
MKKLIILFISIQSIYSNNFDQLNQAIKKLDYDKTLLSFEAETTISNYNKITAKTLVKYDPKNKDPYSLLLKDDKPPTEIDIKKYKKQRSKNKSFSAVDYLGKTFTFVSQEDDIAYYTFTSKKNIIPGFPSKMPGRLWLDVTNKMITKVEILNKEKKVIFPGVSLNMFIMELKFLPFNKDITVLDSMDTFIDAKIFTKKLKQKIKTRTKNYLSVP